MNIQSRKESIIRRLKKIKDENTLSYIDGMLKGLEIQNNYEDALRPMSKEELMNRILKSEQNIINGRTKSISALRKATKKW